jgi:hypothetical protein
MIKIMYYIKPIILCNSLTLPLLQQGVLRVTHMLTYYFHIYVS